VTTHKFLSDISVLFETALERLQIAYIALQCL